MDDIDYKLNVLIQSLKLVASTYETQLSCVPEFAVMPDEIAIIYSDSIVFVDELVEKNKLPKEIGNRLQELDNLFDKMSGVEENWSLEKLKNGQEWQLCRSMSIEILKELGENISQPDLSFLGWFPG